MKTERTPTATWKPARSPAVDMRDEGGRVTLEDPRGRPLIELNDTALAVWDLCDGSTTIEEMVAAILELFDVPRDVVRSDVTRILDQLHRMDLVR